MKEQTKNWIDIATEDFEVAVQLFKTKKYLHCLFFCQQAIEKALKAVYYEKYNKTPPRKHDLLALANDAGIANELDEARCDTFDTLSLYYLESRYGESWGELLKKCTEPAVKDLLEKTRGIFLWLKTRLR